MSHPVVSLDALDRVGPPLLDGLDVDVNTVVKWVGTPPELDLSAFESLVPILRAELEVFSTSNKASDKDLFEGQASVKLYGALADVPLDVLDDPGFWRYVSLKHLWWLARWREEATFVKGDWEKVRAYVDGKRYSECVALRMFIRGRLVSEAGDPSLATDIPGATDLWRSHIMRVRTSYSPRLVAGLLRQQRDARLTTDELRGFARRLNRMASNVVLHTYDATEVESLLEELRS